MVTVRRGFHVGAAALAVGFALAGPSVAAADSGDGDVVAGPAAKPARPAAATRRQARGPGRPAPAQTAALPKPARRTSSPGPAAVQSRPQVSAAAGGTIPVLTGMVSTPGSRSLSLTFNGPLVRDTATDLSNYRITAPGCGNPEFVTSSGRALRIVDARYSDVSSTSSQVTLILARPLRQQTSYRVFINGELPITSGDPNSNPLTGPGGDTYDGDNDGTAGGDFYGLFAVGRRLRFTDSSGDRIVVKATGGSLNVWRELNGDIDQLTVLPGASDLSGSVVPGSNSTGTVYIGSVTIPVPTPLELGGATDSLPSAFQTVPPDGLPQPPPVATAVSPDPVLATAANLPYTLNITPVSAPGTAELPGIQSAVYAQTAPTPDYPSGLWVVFGGRTNGRHDFSADGAKNFPPSFQNQVIYVINPVDWQVWSLPWSQTAVAPSVYSSLSSTNQEKVSRGDTLYLVGGYSKPGTVPFTGDVSTQSDTITVTGGLENLAVGQSVSGVVLEELQVFPPDTTITAINGNAVTTNNAAALDAAGVALVASTGDYTTYDTLTALSVSGLAAAVINGDGANLATLAKIRQTSDPRLGLAGGVLSMLNGRTVLTGGHNFQGAYNGATASIAQVYSDEIRSFRIVDTGRRLGIVGYRAQRDPVNFRRRDGNLVPVIGRWGQAQLAYLGGVFTPSGAGYQAPIPIGPAGVARVDPSYQQFFSQYSAATIPLYDRRSGSNYTILMGGLSLYKYADGRLTEDTNLPWIDNVTSLVRARDGSLQEYIMPPIPAVNPAGTGFYGAYAGFFQNQALPTYQNGVIALNKLTGPTVLGYMYGGIHSIANPTPPRATGASSQVFQITLTPA